MTNSFGKAPGEMPSPVKAPPPVRGGNQFSNAGGGAPPFQPPQLDEFGRDTASYASSVKNPLAAVGDFNQRKANAASMMPQVGAGVVRQPPIETPRLPGGGGFTAPGPRGPMPYDPQGGFGAGAGQGMFPGARQPSPGDFGPPQQEPMGPPPGLQQMFQQPGFMQWLMRMFQSQQGGGAGQPSLNGLPTQQIGPMTQGPPR